MKFKVTMKDPDTLHDAITQAIMDLPLIGLSDAEAEAVRDIRNREVSALCERWFEYGEYLTVEVDTDAETCIVQKK